jgi:SAM-dependent methyltransferase
MISRIFFLLTNNVIINNILIALGLDAWIIARLGLYRRIRLNETLSLQEMAGFSKRKEVQEAIDKTHLDLISTAEKHLPNGGRVLDIGCGAGAYLQDFDNRYTLYGIDLNEQMIRRGRKELPHVNFLEADFMKHDFDTSFNLVYSVSVLEFIPPSRLKAFFRKIHLLLEDDGILFLHYPHALNYLDTWFPDLYYVEYSPSVIEESIRKGYDLLKHEHGFDGRKVEVFDREPFEPGTRTFKNGYLLIARKKSQRSSNFAE